MKQISIVILIVLCVSAVQANAASDAKTQKPIKDGFFLDGIEGSLKTHDQNDFYSYQFNQDVDEPGVFLPAGSAIRILPCSTLEKIIADANEFPDSNYRIWGTVTKYHEKNFLFAAYFLPLSRPKNLTPDTAEKSPDITETTAINNPNDTVTIPEHILSRLRTQKNIQPVFTSTTQFLSDYLLADRTGFITTADAGGAVFTFDALGRNADTLSIELLPCQALQLAQKEMARSPETLRFKIAGIITQYKNRRYMLLQRAARVYSHGNFAR